MTALAGWENFCAIVGSSAGAPIGLRFVVITLISVCDANDRVAGLRLTWCDRISPLLLFIGIHNAWDAVPTMFL